MSRKCYHTLPFKIRAVAVTESQSYPFPSVASGCFSYKCLSQNKNPIQNLQVRNRRWGLVFKDLRYLIFPLFGKGFSL